jgi:hypothetical protein
MERGVDTEASAARPYRIAGQRRRHGARLAVLINTIAESGRFVLQFPERTARTASLASFGETQDVDRTMFADRKASKLVVGSFGETTR